jgi:hypothetical protein
MRVYKLQKYDPAAYDAQGYAKDEWTEVSDIGRTFEGKPLLRDAYQLVEDSYIEAIEALARENNVGELRVYSADEILPPFEMATRDLFGIEWSVAESFRHGDWLSGERMSLFCRLCLRNIQGWALSNERTFFLAFTGEFYVHVGGAPATDDLVAQIRALNLFLVGQGDLGDAVLDNDYYRQLLPLA